MNTRVGLGFALIVQFMHAFADARGESTEIQITSRTPQKLIDLRLQMKTNELAFVCTIKNPSEETLRLASSKSHGNTLMWKTIGEDGNTSHVKTKNRQNFTLKYPLPNSYGITVLPDSEKTLRYSQPQPGVNNMSLSTYTDHELDVFWHFCRQVTVDSFDLISNTFWAGYCRDESPVIPPACTFTNQCMLAVGALFDLSKQGEPHIGFFVMNGSNTAVSVAQPLFNDSRLVVHAPKIGYSNEVFAVDAAATNATVAARGTAEWRMPWTNLWNRLPAADRTSLTNAHEVDLYWRSGGFTSEALPLWIE